MNYNEVISQINSECQRRGMTVYALARLANVPVSTLYGVLHQNNKAQIDTLCEILKALDLQLDIIPIDQKEFNSEGEKLVRSIQALSPQKQDVLKKLVEWL